MIKNNGKQAVATFGTGDIFISGGIRNGIPTLHLNNSEQHPVGTKHTPCPLNWDELDNAEIKLEFNDIRSVQCLYDQLNQMMNTYNKYKEQESTHD